jgi:hypothetical protein
MRHDLAKSRGILPARCRFLLFSIALTLAAITVSADEKNTTDNSQRCINARSIRSADVIDDNYIVFQVQGRRNYLNALPKSCKGLSRDGRFSYETYTRSLCERDTIRVLKESGGGAYEGRSCKLGRFQPISGVRRP